MLHRRFILLLLVVGLIIPALPAFTQSDDFQAGMKLYRQKHYSQAIEVFRRVTDADPKNAAAWYFTGYAHYVSRHFEEAQAAFDKAFEVDPAFDPRPHFRGR